MHTLLLKIMKHYRCEAYLLIILCIAFYLRTFNINWDNGYYFHPDERALVMITLPLHLPSNLGEFLSINSPLNPHFFAYGTFPIYLLKATSILLGFVNPLLRNYGGIHIVGRLLSALFDTGTVFLTYLIGTRLFTKKTGVIAAFLYAFSVLPIQLSHFFAVDTILTFFITATLLATVWFMSAPTIKKASVIGLLFGFCLATKISSAILIPMVIAVFIIMILRTNIRNRKSTRSLIASGVTILISTIVIFIAAQPYALIDYKEFIQQTLQQTQMSNNAFIFPYTLQYVGKIPYWYEFKNILLWGQGIVIASISFIGIISYVYLYIKNKKKEISVILAIYLLIYFLVFGKFAVGFIRYMLPIYPILSIFGGWFVYEIIKKIPIRYRGSYIFSRFALIVFILSIALYPFSYLSIYTHSNTRIKASYWINKNIPQGSKLAIEHWDDSLPVFGRENYIQLALPLYDPDNDTKWKGIKSTLRQVDYIIIASNRLYVPLQKLTDCNKLPSYRCYPLTSSYYKNLLSGKLGFKKVKEFTSQPTIPFLDISINDFSADENFTVFDHPKIMIFKKE